MMTQRPTAELLPADRGNLTPRAAGPLPGAATRAESLPTYLAVRPFNVGDSPKQAAAGDLVMTGDIPDAALARLIEVGAVVDEALALAEAEFASAGTEHQRLTWAREEAEAALLDGVISAEELAGRNDDEGDSAKRLRAAAASLKTEQKRVAGNLAKLRAATNKE